MPYTAFGPPAPAGVETQPVGTVARDHRLMGSTRTGYLREIHDTQQEAMRRTEERRSKGRGKGKAPTAGRPQSEVAVHVHHGNDSVCTICLDAFQHGQRVYRLGCNHLFHERCWDSCLWNDFAEPECPNCRGPGVAKALFPYSGNATAAEAREATTNARTAAATAGATPPAPATAAGSAASSGQTAFEDVRSTESRWTTYFTAEEVSDWVNDWEASTSMTLEEYLEHKRTAGRGNATLTATTEEHGDVPSAADERGNALSGASTTTTTAEVHLKHTTKTKLTDCRLSMLCDLGSRINIIGENTEREFASIAKSYGHQPKYSTRKTRLNVNGVGAGSAPCDTEVELPIAVQCDGESPRTDVFKTNIASGSGANLPAILGSMSMQDKYAVIILRKGREQMVFPGPGGYTIQWSPGTKVLPMVAAPSGHLVIPCDKFAAATTSKPDQALAFLTDHTR